MMRVWPFCSSGLWEELFSRVSPAPLTVRSRDTWSHCHETDESLLLLRPHVWQGEWPGSIPPTWGSVFYSILVL